MTCFDWHDLTVGLPEIWSKFQIEIAASDQHGSYRKKQKYLIQFHNFIKEIEINGRDPEALFHSNIPTRRHNNPTQKFLSILNLLAENLEKKPIILNSFSMGNIDTNVARILSSEFSYIYPSKWAEERKFANGCEKYPELFCKLLSKIANSKAFKSVRKLEFFDTRFENKIAVKLLEEMVTNGMHLTELNMTNFFMFFHHLMAPQRETFDWVLFSRINHVVHLKLDHNMLDTQFLNCIAQSWNASLNEFDIDVRSSYRNLRFEFGQRTTRVQLEWSQFNDRCRNTKVNVWFGKQPQSQWRHDLFCDHYDNVSTTVVLLSKCRRINRVEFKRTDFDEFVTHVKNGYQCMSPEYRHFGTYSLASMSKFSRFLYLKPSIVKTLTHLTMNSVDWLNTEEDVTENIEKYLEKENCLKILEVRSRMKLSFIEKVFEFIKRPDCKLTHLSLIQIYYPDIATEPPLEVKKIKSKKEIVKLKRANIEVIEREPISDEINPKHYNLNLFNSWRTQIQLENIEVSLLPTTSDSDTDTDG